MKKRGNLGENGEFGIKKGTLGVKRRTLLGER